jgi:hypothetical protein
MLPTAYAATGGTGYKIGKDSTSKIIVTAPQAELDSFIAIGTSTASVPAAPPDLTSSGYLSIDVLAYQGVYNDESYYSGGGGFYLYYVSGTWYMSNELGKTTQNYFYGATKLGTYSGAGAYEGGSATVSEIP